MGVAVRALTFLTINMIVKKHMLKHITFACVRYGLIQKPRKCESLRPIVAGGECPRDACVMYAMG